MKYLVWIAMMLFAISMAAQDTVRIIKLNETDAILARVTANEIKQAEKSLQEAKANMDALIKDFEQRYITVEASDPDKGSGYSVGRKGEPEGTPSFATIPSTGVLTLSDSNLCEDYDLHGNAAAVRHGKPCSDSERAEAREKAETKAAAERKKYDAEHPFLYRRKGFENGFRFTEDYKFILPAPESSIYNNWVTFNCEGISATEQNCSKPL
jgi:hypothetical protein